MQSEGGEVTATVSAIEPKLIMNTVYTELRNVRGLNEFERKTLAAIIGRAMWKAGYRRNPEATDGPLVGPGQQTMFEEGA